MPAVVQSIELHVEGACPSAAAFEHALAGLIASAVEVRRAPVRVVDLGARYRVSVGSIEREVEDGPRRCEERAQAAAVIAMLVLAPPVIAIPEPEPEGPQPGDAARATPALTATITATIAHATAPAAESPTTAPDDTAPAIAGPASDVRSDAFLDAGPSGPSYLELEAAILVAGSAGQAGTGAAVAPGAETRVVIRGATFGLGAGLAATLPSDRALVAGSVRITRVQADVSGRIAFALEPIELAVDLGIAVALLELESSGLTISKSATRLSPALRAAAGARWWFSEHFAIAAAIESSFTPSPNELSIQPFGSAGSTGWAWVGGAAGVVTRFD